MTWNFATINEMLHVGKSYGYDIPDNIAMDYTHFKNTRDAVIKRLNGAYERNWNQEGIDLVQGRAGFVEPQTIEVKLADGSGSARYTAPHILLATGGRPNIPPCPVRSTVSLATDSLRWRICLRRLQSWVLATLLSSLLAS